MKVLILANSGIGLYKFRKELIKEFTALNDVFIALPDGEFVNELKNLGCTFIPTEFDRHGTNPFHELKLISLYKRIVKKIKPDIVFTYTIKPNIYGGMACAKLKVPYVANITGLGTAVEKAGLMQKITLSLYRRGLRKAQKVFFQNTENLEFMLNHKVIKTNYELLPGSGVNLDEYDFAEYSLKDTIDFGFIARVMKEKGIDQYLDAAKAIKQKYPETRFHIFGFCEQNYEEKLNELTNSGIVIYHGLVKDMASVYKQLSCVVHPTYYPEGLSNVLLESSASGRPVITTNRSGCREVVDDGVNGYIVNQKDSADLIKKIEKFIQLPHEAKAEMGRAGRRKVEKEFDRKIVVAKYIKELEACDGDKE
ncbi:MAG: glycosyltransferase family 4 protein [Lachnospiraceae bacterium]|nr:glycosyltransferase family 4 protein [Lachnospiraceae bacterium]